MCFKQKNMADIYTVQVKTSAINYFIYLIDILTAFCRNTYVPAILTKAVTSLDV